MTCMTDLVHFSADNIQKNSVLLLGNEAIARGAVEAGIGFATSYPGTPSSEVGDTLERVAEDLGIKFLYSVNEKVAHDQRLHNTQICWIVIDIPEK